MKKLRINGLIVSDPDSPVEQREEDTDSPRPPAVERLWAFSCELSRGRRVSSTAWNKKSPVTQNRHTHLQNNCFFTLYTLSIQFYESYIRKLKLLLTEKESLCRQLNLPE